MHFPTPLKGHPHCAHHPAPFSEHRRSIRATLQRYVISHILDSRRNCHAQWPTTYQKQFSPQNPLNWNFNLGQRVHTHWHPLQNPHTLRRPTDVRPKADKDENQKRYVVLAASSPGQDSKLEPPMQLLMGAHTQCLQLKHTHIHRSTHTLRGRQILTNNIK